jgi:hypothetical protein
VFVPVERDGVEALLGDPAVVVVEDRSVRPLEGTFAICTF